MVPSSVIVIDTNGERLTCGGFSIDETVHLGNFEFIANYFSGLSLSLRRSDTGATFMASAHSGASTPRRAMTEDSVEEFLTLPSGEGSFGLPSQRRCGSRHNHIIEGERSSHSGHDNSFPADGGASAGNWPTF
jgi:hypothetical protein